MYYTTVLILHLYDYLFININKLIFEQLKHKNNFDLSYSKQINYNIAVLFFRLSYSLMRSSNQAYVTVANRKIRSSITHRQDMSPGPAISYPETRNVSCLIRFT